MRINWFSPLLPAKTDIAHYTARILPELSNRADAVLWTDQDVWDKSLEQFAEVRQYNYPDVPWHEVNRGDINFYNVGNNPLFHSSIWRISQKASGIVVVHDSRLQDLFHRLFLGQDRDPEGYVVAMRECYGQKGEDAARNFLGGITPFDEISDKYPLTPLAVRNSLGVVVHIDNNSIEGAYCFHPLPYACNKELYPACRGLNPPYRLVVFGYIGPNRRLTSVLEALGSFDKRKLFTLDVYGAVDNESTCDEKHYFEKISELHLSDIVKIHGFVTEERLNDALRNSHMAINLRYPTMGEASGSQLRIWDHALPSIVTRVGWYASLPEDTVLFVDPEHEIRDLHRHFQSLIDDPARFPEMGERGREVLMREHAPASYADHIVCFSQNAVLMRNVQTAGELVDRITEECRLLGSEGIASSSREKVAGEIFNMLTIG